ncbi:hypothetical protein LPQ31_004588 [Vibrio parahaemolyticus]|nr:hypothetical protein [Vibrio parahaemolyticus]
MEFDVGKWLGKILHEPGNFKILYEYSTSEKHLKEHIASREVYGVSGNARVADLSCSDKKDMIVEAFCSSVSSALETLCNNMNVLAVAFIEGMMKELAVSIFVKHPERMHKYIGDSAVGTVSLKVIIKEESRETLLVNLANTASITLLKGKFSSNIKNLEEITKCSVPSVLKKELIKIVEIRNEFVHEVKIKPFTDEDVERTFDAVYDLLKWMGTTAVEQDVPIHDPANFVLPEHHA